MTVIIDGSTGIVGASWNTANRPSSPAVGQQGFNTDLGSQEIYSGSQWSNMSNSFSATGGTITYSGIYTVHTFRSSGTFTPETAGQVEYLVVAGGGAAGNYGGGGGAGGFKTATNFAVAATGLTVTVGAGGTATNSEPTYGGNGANSVFSSITATGGGGGGGNRPATTAASTGRDGGSGGGATNQNATGAVGDGTGTEGFAGGLATGSAGGNKAGGGGGAGGVGVAGNVVGGINNSNGTGGIGRLNSISGEPIYYAGGGGGEGDGQSDAIGGLGGGGGYNTAGTANTGGGGGGNGDGTIGNRAGGSGIVIIRYPTGSVSTPTTTNVAGTVASVNMLQTRTQDSYTAATTGNGTVITPLNITFTPKQAGNKVILEFTVNGEAQATDMVFLVSRNDVLLTDTTNASNNRWAGIVPQAYDVDSTSTPGNMSIRILDLNTLATESTYKVQVRSSYGTALTFRLNRTYNSAGSDQNEAMLSVVTATEIWT
jgi:hypothetical protein